MLGIFGSWAISRRGGGIVFLLLGGINALATIGADLSHEAYVPLAFAAMAGYCLGRSLDELEASSSEESDDEDDDDVPEYSLESRPVEL
jgi:hypothetical protein